MDKNCQECGQAFIGRADKMYCSNTCRRIAFEKRQAELHIYEQKEEYQQTPPHSLQLELRAMEFAHELEMEKLRLAHQAQQDERIVFLKNELKRSQEATNSWREAYEQQSEELQQLRQLLSLKQFFPPTPTFPIFPNRLQPQPQEQAAPQTPPKQVQQEEDFDEDDWDDELEEDFEDEDFDDEDWDDDDF